MLLQVDHVQEAVNRRLRAFVQNRYLPLVKRCIRNRYLTLSLFMALLILCSGLVLGGLVRTVIAPDVPGEYIQAEIRMVQGTPTERTTETVKKVAQAMHEVESEYQLESGTDEPLIQHIAAYGFEQINGALTVELTKEDQRSIHTSEIARRWREAITNLHGVEVMSVSTQSLGPPLPLICCTRISTHCEPLRRSWKRPCAATMAYSIYAMAPVILQRNSISIFCPKQSHWASVASTWGTRCVTLSMGRKPRGSSVAMMRSR